MRRTVSTCAFSIFEGYTTEQCASLELEVPLPKCVIEASTGFRREYTLEQSRDKQVEEELTWSVESNIRVRSFEILLLFKLVTQILLLGEILIDILLIFSYIRCVSSSSI